MTLSVSVILLNHNTRDLDLVALARLAPKALVGYWQTIVYR